MRCVLLYNPAAGRNRHEREKVVDRIADALRRQGHSAKVITTIGPETAAGLARDAASTADVIFACGGDGTVHAVIQGLASDAGEPRAALGVIPLGSANALARHLRISLHPVSAALQQVNGRPCAIPVGRLVYGDGVRYFILMAGAGPDGALGREVELRHKSNWGRLAYYVQAARLFATRSFPAFEVEFKPVGSETVESLEAVEVMAVRADSLGGLFGKLVVKGTSVHDAAMKLHILRPPALVSLPLWFVSSWLNLHEWNPLLKVTEADGFVCRPIGSFLPQIQADGEWLGPLPMEVSVVPDALRILLPAPAPQNRTRTRQLR